MIIIGVDFHPSIKKLLRLILRPESTKKSV